MNEILNYAGDVICADTESLFWNSDFRNHATENLNLSDEDSESLTENLAVCARYEVTDNVAKVTIEVKMNGWTNLQMDRW